MGFEGGGEAGRGLAGATGVGLLRSMTIGGAELPFEVSLQGGDRGAG